MRAFTYLLTVLLTVLGSMSLTAVVQVVTDCSVGVAWSVGILVLALWWGLFFYYFWGMT